MMHSEIIHTIDILFKQGEVSSAFHIIMHGRSIVYDKMLASRFFEPT